MHTYEESYAIMSEVRAGDKLVADGGFTCIATGAILDVHADADGALWVPCNGSGDDTHKHYLLGQLGADGELIGLTPVRDAEVDR